MYLKAQHLLLETGKSNEAPTLQAQDHTSLEVKTWLNDSLGTKLTEDQLKEASWMETMMIGKLAAGATALVLAAGLSGCIIIDSEEGAGATVR